MPSYFGPAKNEEKNVVENFVLFAETLSVCVIVLTV
jgi:hypothetical protein